MEYQFLSQYKLFKSKIITFLHNNSNLKKNDLGLEGYTFIKDLTPKESTETGRVGIYFDRNSKKVVIKKHSFSSKDEDFYYLLNEASIMRILNNISTDTKVEVPKILKVNKRKNLIAIISNFTDGEIILGQNDELILSILKECIQYLDQVSSIIRKNKYNIMSKTAVYFLISFPYLYAKVIIKSPKNLLYYIKIAGAFYASYVAGNPFSQKLFLSHCELYQDSILFDKKTNMIKLIDWETAVMSDKFYDLALISRFYFKEINKEKLKNLITNFIKNSKDYKRFVGLGIYGSFEFLANKSYSIKNYEDIKRYLNYIFSLNKHYE